MPRSYTSLSLFTRLLIYGLLLLLGVPWYWGFVGQDPPRLWWGAPAWFVVAVLASAATSSVTAFLLRRPWPEELEPSEPLP